MSISIQRFFIHALQPVMMAGVAAAVALIAHDPLYLLIFTPLVGYALYRLWEHWHSEGDDDEDDVARMDAVVPIPDAHHSKSFSPSNNLLNLSAVVSTNPKRPFKKTPSPRLKIESGDESDHPSLLADSLRSDDSPRHYHQEESSNSHDSSPGGWSVREQFFVDGRSEEDEESLRSGGLESSDMEDLSNLDMSSPRNLFSRHLPPSQDHHLHDLHQYPSDSVSSEDVLMIDLGGPFDDVAGEDSLSAEEDELRIRFGGFDATSGP
jgi:hypothetical protein